MGLCSTLHAFVFACLGAVSRAHFCDLENPCPTVVCDEYGCSSEATHTIGFEWTLELIAATKPMPKQVVGMDNFTQGSKGPPRASGGCAAPHAVNLDTSPERDITKVRFRQGGDNYMCSGSFINKSILLTAGHCCYTPHTGEWHSNFAAFTHFQNDRYHHRYTAIRLTVGRMWFDKGQHGGFAHDYCFATFSDGPENWVDVLWKQTPSTTVYAYGYPYDIEGTGRVPRGEQMEKATGHVGFYTGTSVEGNLEMSCNPLGGGCSGGPWITVSEGHQYVLGLNSFSYRGRTGFMYSPYFGIHWYRHCCKVGGCHNASSSINLLGMQDEPGSISNYQSGIATPSGYVGAAFIIGMLGSLVRYLVSKRASRRVLQKPLLA